jgi:CRP/FNR family transcriptional regulator, anaerobic regulatory protein
MSVERIEAEVQEAYGFMFEPELIEAIAQNGMYREIQAGDVLITPGEPLQHMPILLEGSIKIMRVGPDGGEMLLYYIERGDTCAMSMSCCMGQKKSEILAVAEERTRIVMVPVQFMDRWLSQFPTWKSFVFESYNHRLSELLDAIDNIAFLNLDDRLIRYLHDKVKVLGSTELQLTHQDIANELNTSRVVISRLLKQLEKKGEISLHRNRIVVENF